jgi:DNA-binding LacI/PurR family transcriptional regulator
VVLPPLSRVILVAVVGFDDIEAALYTVPPLTTIRSPMTSLVTETARLMLGLPHGAPGNIVIMPSGLVSTNQPDLAAKPLPSSL